MSRIHRPAVGLRTIIVAVPSSERANRPGLMADAAGKVVGTIDAFPTVRLELESRPECVTLVRSVLSGLGAYLGLDPEPLDDIKTAVSEACNNAVVHAYSGEDPGPLSVGVEITPAAVEVIVRDQGSGIQRLAVADDHMGVGLAVISALASRAEFESSPDQGTEVRMSFTGAGVRDALARRSGQGAAGTRPTPLLAGDIVAWISPPDLLGMVMGRIVRTAAASAGFTVDRFAVLQQLTNAMGERATQPAADGEIGVAIIGTRRRVELRVGPLPALSTEQLFEGAEAPPDLAPLLEQLYATPLTAGESLTAVLVEPRR